MVKCDVAREALSARIDGELEPVPSRRVDEHLRSCADCRSWNAEALRMNAMVQSLVDSDPARSIRVESDVVPPPPPAPARRPFLRWALAGTGILQLLLALAQSFGIDFGMVAAHHGAATGAHLLNESTAWSAALGVVTLLAAFRPRLAPGLACVLLIYVALLVFYIALDGSMGQVTLSRVLSHIPVALAALLTTLSWRAADAPIPPDSLVRAAGANQTATQLRLLRQNDDPAA